MLTLRRKTDYALLAAATLAQRGVAVSARDLAAATGVQLPMLSSVLKLLHRRGLLLSARGARGGYWLVRPAEEISLAEVIDAAEGAQHLAPCCDHSEPQPCQPCRLEHACPITTRMRQVNEEIRAVLTRHTVADLVATHPVRLNIRPAPEAAPEAAPQAPPQAPSPDDAHALAI